MAILQENVSAGVHSHASAAEESREHAVPHRPFVESDTAIWDGPEPIAIVGMGCRWPGDVSNPSQLWNLLEQQGCGLSEFPADRFNVDGWYHPKQQRPGSFYTRGGFFIKDDPRLFDHGFFGVSPVETRTMDPSQRKLLEVTFEAFENAGEPWEQFCGSKTGVYVGNFGSDHQHMQYRDADYLLPHMATGGDTAILSNRVNYVFDLKGPSMTLNTACSSSMYALHLAVAGLRSGDCEAAIVAGSNIILEPAAQISGTKLGAISPTSISHTFDASADGYARADGFGALYLMPISKALMGPYTVRAVIRGTAISANGHSDGISHPSSSAQAEVIRQAYVNAGGLDPALTDYFECHGTGTPVGDPIEVAAIGEVFARSRANPLLIGSIKPNLGHSESASAIASIMKVVLALERGQIPPTRGILNLNPAIDFIGSSTRVVTEMTPWPRSLRRASLNSFGYGGSNAHAIIEFMDKSTLQRLSRLLLSARLEIFPHLPTPIAHMPNETHDRSSHNGISRMCADLIRSTCNGATYSIDTTPKESNSGAHHRSCAHSFLYVFSAHTEQSLRKNITQLAGSVQAFDAHDLAYTLSTRRSRFAYRTYLVSTFDELPLKMGSTTISFQKPRSINHTTPRLAIVFTGQGAQWQNMGRELLRSFSLFRQAIQEHDKILSLLPEHAGSSWSIEKVISGDNDIARRIHEPEISQTVCTSLQIALYQLLVSLGVETTAVVGHSSGELAAAYAARRLSVAESLVLSFYRGHAVAENKKHGSMLAVGLGIEDARSYIDRKAGVTVAAINSPSSVILSGEAHAISSVAEHLTNNNVFNRFLQTGQTAYHSPYMTAVGSKYEHMATEGLRRVQGSMVGTLDQSPVLWISSVFPSKDMETCSVAPDYWRKNLESPVLFHDAIKYMQQRLQIDTILEIGPHSTLQGPLKQIFDSTADLEEFMPTYLNTLTRGKSDVQSLLEMGGKLFLQNHHIDIEALNTQELCPKGTVCIDMPSYVYTYGPVLYHENRLNKEWRCRRHLHHDLLGVRQVSSSDLCPSWRNVLRLKDVPWLEDHMIASRVIFPAAGYLAMATEALLQQKEDLDSFATLSPGVSFRNVNINSALEIPSDDSGIEIVLSMQKSVQGFTSDTSTSWHDFTISALNDNSHVWVNCCTGTVSVEESRAEGVDHIRRDQARHSTPCILSESVVQELDPFDSDQWYSKFLQLGLEYGPTFRTISELRVAKNQSAASVDLHPTTTLAQAETWESSYLIHPVTIDACLQLSLIASFSDSRDFARSAYVPVLLDSMTIWPARHAKSNEKGFAMASGNLRGQRGLYAKAQLFDMAGNMLMNIGSLKCVMYDAQRETIDTASNDPFMSLLWKPDVATMSFDEARKEFPAPCSQHEVSTILQRLDQLSTLMLVSISENFSNFGVIDDHRPFMEWAHRCHSRALAGEIPYSVESIHATSEERAKMISTIARDLDFVPEARLMQRIFNHLPEILSGQTSSVQIAQDDGLLTEVYASGIGFANAYQQLQKILDLIAHKTPNLRVIEVGAGTGGATTGILQTLDSSTRFKRYQEYVFTDVAPAFLSTAMLKFEAHKSLSFRLLNIEQRPAGQGFEEASFDLVIASQVLHATESLANTIRNVRQLLKPGGRMVFLELTSPPNAAGLLVGTFPFYWKGMADGRPDGPFASKERWNHELLSNGFSGIDILLSDHPAGQEIASVIVTTAVDANDALYRDIRPPITVLLLNYQGPSPLSREFSTNLSNSNMQCVDKSLLFDEIEPNAHIISFISCEEQQEVFYQDERIFTKLKRLLITASSMLWISSSDRKTYSTPITALIASFLRTVSREMPRIRITQLHVEGLAEKGVLHVVRVALKHLEQLCSASGDNLYYFHNGLLHISRLVPAANMNTAFRSQESIETKLVSVPINHLGPVKVGFGQPGVPSTLRFENDDQMLSPLHEDWVEIRSEAIELNMKDLAVLMGRFDWNTYSLTCCGIVSKVGTEVKGVQLGDRVCGMAFGNFGNYVRTPATLVQRFALSDDPIGVASLPISYLAAVYSLMHVARLQRGETILIHSATSSLGLALLRLARHLGGDIYVTVGSSSKVDALERDFGVPRERIFPSRKVDTWRSILEQTGGIDVICSCSSGEHMQDSWRCKGPLGRFIDLGRLDVLSRGKLAMEVFERNATFTSFDISLIRVQKPQVISRLMEEVATLYRQGVVKPVDVIKTFDISELQQAIKYMAKGGHIGKVVVTYKSPSALLPMTSETPRVSLDPDAAYVLVGCSKTGVGSVIGPWMISRGARHLINLSRSGHSTAPILLSDAVGDDATKRAGIISSIRCDVTNLNDVRMAISDIRKIRPIKGIVHAAAVFEDCNFETLSFAQLQRVLGPKVQGTINLHEATLQEPLDFFIMTSSIVALINTATQASYSAANSFQDAFASFRRSLGLPALALALGMISDIGFASRHADIQKSLKRNGLYGTSPADLKKLLDIVFSNVLQQGNRTDNLLSDAYLVVGMEPRKIYELGNEADFIWSSDPRFSRIVQAINDQKTAQNDNGKVPAGRSAATEVGDLIASAKNYSSSECNAAEKPPALYDLANSVLSTRLAKLLFLPVTDIDVKLSIGSYGVDSMVAAELRSWLLKTFGLNVTFGELVATGMKVETLGSLIVESLARSCVI